MSKQVPSKEWQLINSISQKCSLNLEDNPFEMEIGDDCAVRRGDLSKQLISGDTLVEDVHFSLDYMSLKEVGFKSIASNISDIAAMGGVLDSLIVQVVFPQNSSKKVEELYDGIGEAVQKWQTPVVGGDLSKGPCWMIAVTVLGRSDNRILYRNGANDGDKIYVTKTPGKSAIGLDLLQKFGRKEADRLGAEFVLAHISPVPSIKMGVSLAKNSLVHSCLDISDGVLKEVRTLAKESGVGANLFLPKRVYEKLNEGANFLEKEPLHYFLNSGEEYGLIFTADSGFDESEFDEVFCIGEITEDVGVVNFINSDGEVEVLSQGGWNHI